MALPAIAQSQSFATITVNPARSADPRNAHVEFLPNGNFIATAVPMVTLLSSAYDMPANALRVSPLPDWTITERYDIEAKARTHSSPPSFRDSEVRTQRQRMILEVLADGFKLVMRVENKTMPVYSLAVVGGGPKLQRLALTEMQCGFGASAEECHHFVGGLGHPLNARAVDMDDLVHYIGNWTDLPVVNRTALRGLFTINSEGWAPMRLPPPPPGTTPAGNPFAGLPTIFEVLDKFGLELKRQEDVLPVYTVERVERPPSN